MSLTETKKSPLISLPFLKKRLRRITGLGLRNLTVNEFNFTVHFTLHRNDKTVAFYTSELIENQRSPEWCYLKFPVSVQCLQDFVMRIWITSSNNCRLFLEYDVHLDDSLVPDEQKDDSHKSNNSLWLEMFGYRFTDSESILNNPKTIPTTLIDKKLTLKRSNFTKSYNKLSISRMINVIHAIRTEKQASVLCLQRLQTLADANEDYSSKIKERESRQLCSENLRACLQSQISIYERSFNTYQQRQKIIDEKKIRLEQNLLELLSQHEELNRQINQLNQSKSFLQDLIQLITFRQKEIVIEIYRYVYPIVCDNKNEYSIANVKLPQAEDKIYQTSLTRERENEIAAAVGFCSHFVLIISQFIQLPLRFPIECYGTSSIKIYDYTLPSSDFPLSPSYDNSSFRYGLFLLNRNIGQIMHHCRVGGRNTDFRKTLENLKELMEQCFTNSNNTNQIQLYASNRHSTEPVITANSSIERLSIQHKRHSTVNSLFPSFHSSRSSLHENHDLDQNEDENDDKNLYPPLNTLSPRLTMQFSHQPQQ